MRTLKIHCKFYPHYFAEGAPINAPTLMDAEDYNARVRSLEERVRVMQEDRQCQICMERDKNMVYLCGHGACKECSERLEICHVCRTPIQNKIEMFGL